MSVANEGFIWLRSIQLLPPSLGAINYAASLGISVDQASALCITRRCLGFCERINCRAFQSEAKRGRSRRRRIGPERSLWVKDMAGRNGYWKAFLKSLPTRPQLYGVEWLQKPRSPDVGSVASDKLLGSQRPTLRLITETALTCAGKTSTNR